MDDGGSRGGPGGGVGVGSTPHRMELFDSAQPWPLAYPLGEAFLGHNCKPSEKKKPINLTHIWEYPTQTSRGEVRSSQPPGKSKHGETGQKKALGHFLGTAQDFKMIPLPNLALEPPLNLPF